ncbi:hypothetical protein TanjilG_25709 [Lupinus angustifolius]|uniref:Uncharacterized protein n=1 Tax=Lupinus angustifolius TaxID=3871 RepID=A0A1J7HI55_LUPAN|nr:hypothetical protein TanjilG_25709 [Lupinus angustifolius]
MLNVLLQINKPYLPLVSGELSFNNGVIIVASSFILVFWICVSLLQMAYGVAIMMGALSPFLSVKIVMNVMKIWSLKKMMMKKKMNAKNINE